MVRIEPPLYLETVVELSHGRTLVLWRAGENRGALVASEEHESHISYAEGTAILYREAGKEVASKFGIAAPLRRAGVSVGLVMRSFAWFCRGETREIVFTAAADLQRDAREMEAQGCSRWHVRAVRCWATLRTIVPIFADGMGRVGRRLPVLGGLVRFGSAILRRIDPPKPG